MDVHASTQSDHASVAYQILKWSVFVIELLLLCVLLMVTFLVPVPPSPYGKVPQEALLVGLSAIVSIATGALFLRRKQPSMSLARLLVTPPCVVGMTVIAIVVVPIAIGFMRGR